MTSSTTLKQFPMRTLIWCAILWVLLPIVMVLGVPKAVELFADYGVTLSALTIFVIDISWWLGGNYPHHGAMSVPGALVLAPVWLVLIAVPTLLAVLPRTRAKGRLALVALSLALSLCAGAVLLSVGFPLLSLATHA